MAIFYSHQDRLRDLTGGSRSALQMSAKRLRVLMWAIRRTGAAFNIIHQAIVTAKMRRLQRELMFHTGSCDDWSLQPNAYASHDLDKDAAKFPQRPLILGDKWDF
jgi:hypothetical protein